MRGGTWECKMEEDKRNLVDELKNMTNEQVFGALEARRNDLEVAIENNVERARPLREKDFAEEKRVTLVFGSEGEGISHELLEEADDVRYIESFGSTRSVNVGVASGIVMYEWVRQRVL